MLRDECAMRAMVAIMTTPAVAKNVVPSGQPDQKDIAAAAYLVADAMMMERAK
jgi:hypothetical protein